MAATIKYFGRFPTTVVLQSSTNFDGTAQTGTPAITPGVYTFPEQVGGGLYNLHEGPIEVKQIAYSGGGACLVTKVMSTTSPAQEVLLATLDNTTPTDLTNFFLAPGEYLKITSSGATTPKITLTASEAAYSHDGGG